MCFISLCFFSCVTQKNVAVLVLEHSHGASCVLQLAVQPASCIKQESYATNNGHPRCPNCKAREHPHSVTAYFHPLYHPACPILKCRQKMRHWNLKLRKWSAQRMLGLPTLDLFFFLHLFDFFLYDSFCLSKCADMTLVTPYFIKMYLMSFQQWDEKVKFNTEPKYYYWLFIIIHYNQFKTH